MIKEKPDSYIHPTAIVSGEAQIGRGTRIWHQAQVREGAQIGKNCILGKGVYVDFDVTIGDNCKLQNGVFVYNPARLGDGVFLGPGVIITNDATPRAVNPDMSLKTSADWDVSAVSVGSGASIGAGALVLPGLAVGRWAMVGAGSVVTGDVPHYALVYGNPARQAGYVCPCGQRLRHVEGQGRLRCDACGRRITIKEPEGAKP